MLLLSDNVERRSVNVFVECVRLRLWASGAEGWSMGPCSRGRVLVLGKGMEIIYVLNDGWTL